MTDTTNTLDGLTEQDEVDLELLTAAEEKHTLLQIWQDILSNAEASAAERVTAAMANRVVSVWPKLSYQDVPRYHKLYHERLITLRTILSDVIEKNPKCLENIENDGVDNRALYLELLFSWQVQIGVWERAWDASDRLSAVQLATIADVTAFFVGNTGLLDHLGQIGFVFNDDDRNALAEKLIAAQGER